MTQLREPTDLDAYDPLEPTVDPPLHTRYRKVALEEVAARVDRWALVPGAELRYEPSYVLRGLETLPLHIRRAADARTGAKEGIRREDLPGR